MLPDISSGLDSGEPSGRSVREAASPYFRALRHHWRFVIVITVLAAAVTSATLLRSHRSYQGSASVLLTPLPTGDPAWVDIGAIITSGDPERDTQTGVALIESAQTARATAQAMGAGWTTASVQDAVSVTPLGESDVISVTATGSTPQQAARLATTFATQAVALRSALVQSNVNRKLTSLRAQVTSLTGKAGSSTALPSLYSEISELEATHGDPTLSVSQAAQPPTAPIGTSRVLLILLSIVGGFIIASVAALGLEFLSRPVRDEAELTETFPAPVLATIPAIRRAGPRPVDPWRLTPGAFEQMRMLRIQFELQQDEAAPLIMVTSAGPGDGKTSLVSGLAASFSESGHRTIVVDLDLRKPSLAKALMVDVPKVTRLRREAAWLDRALIPVPALPNVSLLPLAQIGDWGIEEIMEQLPQILHHVHSLGAVVIDTAPVGAASETLRIAQLCKSSVVVARLRHTDRRQLARTRELLLRVGAPPTGLVIVGKQLMHASGDGYAYDYGYRHAPQRSGLKSRSR